MQSSLVIQKVRGKIGGSLFLSKLSNFLSGVIVFFASTQLGLHFWPLSSLVYGIRVDYLAPTLYFLDLLIVLYLLVCGYFKNYWKFGAILLTNLLFSNNPLSTLSWSLHFLLYLLFILAVPKNQLLRAAYYALPATILFQLALAAGQVALGHSVGGAMYYLGERSVSVGAPGIALGSFMEQVVLRAYGTFGHPNLLAGWFVVSLLILLKIVPPRNTLYPILYTALAACGVALTQSRSGALALFGFIIPFYLIKNIKIRLLYYSITLLLCFSLFPSLLTPPRSELSTSERLTLQRVSLSVIRTFPIFGSGTQASISTYPTIAPNLRLLQPDHNTFTLFLSWFGVFGVLAILYSLRPVIIPAFSFLIPVVPLLALDHYFLTSPQGLFILLLYLKLNYSHVQKNHQ